MKNITTIAIKCTDDLKRAIQKLADQERRTLSMMCKILLEEALHDRNREEKEDDAKH